MRIILIQSRGHNAERIFVNVPEDIYEEVKAASDKYGVLSDADEDELPLNDDGELLLIERLEPYEVHEHDGGFLNVCEYT